MSEIMRGLTLTQPWASLVAFGWKGLETRGWATGYRGPLAIHAGKTIDDDARAMLAHPRVRELLPDVDDLPRGAVLATVNLTEVWSTPHALAQLELLATGGHPAGPPGLWVRYPADEQLFGNYARGRFAFRLAQLQRLDRPIPARGALGLWKVPPRLVAEIETEIRRTVMLTGGDGVERQGRRSF